MFSPAIVGLFAMAKRLMMIPVALIGEAVRRTYMQKAAELDNRTMRLRETLLKTSLGLLFIGLVIFAPLVWWGADIFRIVLGAQWEEAGEYVAVLAPWFLAMLVQSTPSVAYIVHRRQDLLLKFQIVSTLLMLVAFALSYYYDATIIQTLAALSFIGTVTNLVIVAKGFFLSGKNRSPD